MQLDLFGNGTPPPASNGDAHKNQHPQYTASNPMPYPPAHHNAPRGTSEVAAAMIAPHTNSMRDRVLMAIIESEEHGLTDDEGEQQLRIIPQSYTPRRRELVILRMVQDSGNRRITSNGGSAAVWIAVAQQTKQPPE